MGSWRDTTSAEAQDQMDGLLETALDMAQRRLTESDQLPPFAITVTAQANWEVVSPYAMGSAGGDDLARDLWSALRSSRDHYQAVAVVTDVSLGNADAVQVHVEHAEPTAPALVMAVPYTRHSGDAELGTVRAAQSERTVWV